MQKILNSWKLVLILFLFVMVVMYLSMRFAGLQLSAVGVSVVFGYYFPVFIGLTLLYFVARMAYTELNYPFFLNVLFVVILSKELPGLVMAAAQYMSHA